MTLPARLIAHAECHESQPELMSDPEQRQWAADLREAAGLLEWRSVRELPPEDSYVLCWWSPEKIEGAAWVKDEFNGVPRWYYMQDGDVPNKPPTHWMPLPTAPKEPRQ